MTYEQRVWATVRTALMFALLIFIAVRVAEAPAPVHPKAASAYSCYRFNEVGTAIPCSEWYLWKGIAAKTLRSI
jgi:hypothetical protein